jgi:hypothetical protein
MKRIFAVILAVLVLAPQGALAGSLNVNFGFEGQTSPLQVKGGQQTVLYGSDVVTINNTILTDSTWTAAPQVTVQPVEQPAAAGTQQQPAGATSQKQPEVVVPTATVGASTFYSDNLKVYAIPMSYQVADRIKLQASIPYVDRKLEYQGKEYTKKGLGDISVGGVYVWGTMGKGVATMTELAFILPTGDKNATDQDFHVPLGSGSYAFAVTQTFSKLIEGTRVRIFGNVGFRYALDSDYKIANDKVDIQTGNLYSAVIGGEYYVGQRLSIEIKENYALSTEGKQRTNGGSWQDSNDYLQASDFIAAVKYRLKGNWAAILTAIVPVYTKSDPDVSDPDKRKAAMAFTITKLF